MTLKLLIAADIIKTKVCFKFIDTESDCDPADFIYFWDPEKTPAYKIPEIFMESEVLEIDCSIDGKNLLITLL